MLLADKIILWSFLVRNRLYLQVLPHIQKAWMTLKTAIEQTELALFSVNDFLQR